MKALKQLKLFILKKCFMYRLLKTISKLLFLCPMYFCSLRLRQARSSLTANCRDWMSHRSMSFLFSHKKKINKCLSELRKRKHCRNKKSDIPFLKENRLRLCVCFFCAEHLFVLINSYSQKRLCLFILFFKHVCDLSS